MCPACISNAVLIVTGAVSAGGWTAFTLRPRAERRADAQERRPCPDRDRQAQERERQGDAKSGVTD